VKVEPIVERKTVPDEIRMPTKTGNFTESII
jgi:hypothetical protein